MPFTSSSAFISVMLSEDPSLYDMTVILADPLSSVRRSTSTLGPSPEEVCRKGDLEVSRRDCGPGSTAAVAAVAGGGDVGVDSASGAIMRMALLNRIAEERFAPLVIDMLMPLVTTLSRPALEVSHGMTILWNLYSNDVVFFREGLHGRFSTVAGGRDRVRVRGPE